VRHARDREEDDDRERAELDGHQRITILPHSLTTTVAAMIPNFPTKSSACAHR
jgi:hypothetical protein